MKVPFQQPILANRYQGNRTEQDCGILTPTAITIGVVYRLGCVYNSHSHLYPNRIPLSKPRDVRGGAVTKAHPTTQTSTQWVL